MLGPHVIELFDAVSVGTRVTVTRESLSSAGRVVRTRGRSQEPGGS